MEASATATERHPGEAWLEFEGFFLEHHEPLFRAFWLVTRNRHEAEEVMQDAFLRLLERWPEIQAAENLDGYLYRTAMNVFRSRLRRASHAVHPPEDPLERLYRRRERKRHRERLTAAGFAIVLLMAALGGSLFALARVWSGHGRAGTSSGWTPERFLELHPGQYFYLKGTALGAGDGSRITQETWWAPDGSGELRERADRDGETLWREVLNLLDFERSPHVLPELRAALIEVAAGPIPFEILQSGIVDSRGAEPADDQLLFPKAARPLQPPPRPSPSLP